VLAASGRAEKIGGMNPPPTAVSALAPTTAPPDLDRLCVDAIRVLAMDAVEAANSGHPGMPMAMAPVAYTLFARVMRHDPRDPDWPDRDRFVLSAGHASMLLYATLHLSGYDLPLDDLRRFRQWGSPTAGHPERGHAPGVETTTGPLGQGFANGVGMAMAERFLRERYGAEVCDHRVFALCSDGDLMEGVSSEAASLAGQLGLGRLVYVYDDNEITIDGPTSLSFSREDVDARFRAQGWHVQAVDDAEDLAALEEALEAAVAETDRPSLVRVRSTIAWPAPNARGTSGSHGAPLGEAEVGATKAAMGWDPDRVFFVPDEVYEAFGAVERGAAASAAWRERFGRWRAADPGRAAEWDRAWAELPESGLAEALAMEWEGERIATRAAGGQVMEAFAPFVPTMVGGSADLAGSVKTGLPGEERTVHFGVREHAMGGVVNGLALHGGILRPYGSTFLVFSDYMRPAIRLSALMGLRVAWVFSHDSLGLGEDGPTHQPVEHLAALRAIPGLTVLRPADAAETAEAWRVVLEELDGPAVLVLTRQGVPVLDRGRLAPAAALGCGGYVLAPGEDAAIVATGSEVALALAARDELAAGGIAARVVSMPSLELFEAQEAEYRAATLPPGMPTVSIEAATTFGWERYADASVGVDGFGASAPGAEVLERYGITAAAAAAAVRDLLSAGSR
jgi:transketolase